MMSAHWHHPTEQSAAAVGTRRILLTISYDGTAYAGWQRQKNAIGIQQRIEESLEKLTGDQLNIIGASRTDAGVHALGQCAHFDTTSRIPPEKFPYALNTCLPSAIRVLKGVPVSRSFHARFSAKAKQYTYRILNAPHASAIERNYFTHIPVLLDLEAMEHALSSLTGTHDFAAFQAAGGTAKTTIRTLSMAKLEQAGPKITLTLVGNGYLYHMARTIAGTLIEIGQHKLEETAFRQAISTHDRLTLGYTAPAHGLELTQVFYDNEQLSIPEGF